MHWRDKSDTVSTLETEDQWGYERVLAVINLHWGTWLASRRDGTIIGKFATEDEAKAVTLVTIRMEQADEPTRLEPTRRPHIVLKRSR